jgi:uncharacterized membrane protein
LPERQQGGIQVKNSKIHRMVGVALLIAVMVVLQFIGTIFPIKIGPVSISLVLIPIVIGAAVYGPAAGAVLGAAFGILANIFCANGMDFGGHMVFQASPVMCIVVVMLKGICCGLAAGFVYKLLAKWNGYIAMLCAAIVCPVVNTGFFIACMLTFFKDVLAAWAGGGDIIAYIMTGLILLNFVPELILNIVFGTVGHTIVHVVKSK